MEGKGYASKSPDNDEDNEMVANTPSPIFVKKISRRLRRPNNTTQGESSRPQCEQTSEGGSCGAWRYCPSSHSTSTGGVALTQPVQSSSAAGLCTEKTSRHSVPPGRKYDVLQRVQDARRKVNRKFRRRLGVDFSFSDTSSAEDNDVNCDRDGEAGGGVGMMADCRVNGRPTPGQQLAGGSTVLRPASTDLDIGTVNVPRGKDDKQRNDGIDRQRNDAIEKQRNDVVDRQRNDVVDRRKNDVIDILENDFLGRQRNDAMDMHGVDVINMEGDDVIGDSWIHRPWEDTRPLAISPDPMADSPPSDSDSSDCPEDDWERFIMGLKATEPRQESPAGGADDCPGARGAPAAKSRDVSRQVTPSHGKRGALVDLDASCVVIATPTVKASPESASRCGEAVRERTTSRRDRPAVGWHAPSRSLMGSPECFDSPLDRAMLLLTEKESPSEEEPDAKRIRTGAPHPDTPTWTTMTSSAPADWPAATSSVEVDWPAVTSSASAGESIVTSSTSGVWSMMMSSASADTPVVTSSTVYSGSSDVTSGHGYDVAFTSAAAVLRQRAAEGSANGDPMAMAGRAGSRFSSGTASSTVRSGRTGPMAVVSPDRWTRRGPAARIPGLRTRIGHRRATATATSPGLSRSRLIPHSPRAPHTPVAAAYRPPQSPAAPAYRAPSSDSVLLVSPATAAGHQMAEDEAMARRLQEEDDRAFASALASSASTPSAQGPASEGRTEGWDEATGRLLSSMVDVTDGWHHHQGLLPGNRVSLESGLDDSLDADLLRLITEDSRGPAAMGPPSGVSLTRSAAERSPVRLRSRQRGPANRHARTRATATVTRGQPDPDYEVALLMQQAMAGRRTSHRDFGLGGLLDTEVLSYLGRSLGRTPPYGRNNRRRSYGYHRASALDQSRHDGNDYEELWQLAERLGDVKRQGLTRQQIDMLPTKAFRLAPPPPAGTEGQPAGVTGAGEAAGAGTAGAAGAADGGADTPMCNICMSVFCEGERLRVLPCLHDYHAPCIDQWLKEHASCPCCRVQVTLD